MEWHTFYCRQWEMVFWYSGSCLTPLLCTPVLTCTYMYVHVHAFVRVFVYVSLHACVCVCACVRTFVCACVRTFVCVHVWERLCVCMRENVYVCACVRVFVSACVYACVVCALRNVFMRLCMCMCVCICMCVCMYVRVSVCMWMCVCHSGSLTSSCRGTQWKTVASGAVSHPDHSRGREWTITPLFICIKWMCLYFHRNKHASNSEMHLIPKKHFLKQRKYTSCSFSGWRLQWLIRVARDKSQTCS